MIFAFGQRFCVALIAAQRTLSPPPPALLPQSEHNLNTKHRDRSSPERVKESHNTIPCHISRPLPAVHTPGSISLDALPLITVPPLPLPLSLIRLDSLQNLRPSPRRLLAQIEANRPARSTHQLRATDYDRQWHDAEDEREKNGEGLGSQPQDRIGSAIGS